jgi:hypothetical protein
MDHMAPERDKPKLKFGYDVEDKDLSCLSFFFNTYDENVPIAGFTNQ